MPRQSIAETWRTILADGAVVTVRGRSMTPTLWDGSRIAVAAPVSIWPGDVVVFIDRHGQRVCHRALGPALSLRGWLMQGDGCAAPDAPVPSRAIVAVARVPRRVWPALRRYLVALPFDALRALRRAIDG